MRESPFVHRDSPFLFTALQANDQSGRKKQRVGPTESRVVIVSVISGRLHQRWVVAPLCDLADQMPFAKHSGHVLSHCHWLRWIAGFEGHFRVRLAAQPLQPGMLGNRLTDTTLFLVFNAS
jgi:hypothetical protein